MPFVPYAEMSYYERAAANVVLLEDKQELEALLELVQLQLQEFE